MPLPRFCLVCSQVARERVYEGSNRQLRKDSELIRKRKRALLFASRTATRPQTIHRGSVAYRLTAHLLARGVGQLAIILTKLISQSCRSLLNRLDFSIRTRGRARYMSREWVLRRIHVRVTVPRRSKLPLPYPTFEKRNDFPIIRLLRTTCIYRVLHVLL